jgi:hypothetical protein
MWNSTASKSVLLARRAAAANSWAGIVMLCPIMAFFNQRLRIRQILLKLPMTLCGPVMRFPAGAIVPIDDGQADYG